MPFKDILNGTLANKPDINPLLYQQNDYVSKSAHSPALSRMIFTDAEY